MVFMTFYDDLNFFFLKYSDAVESEKLAFIPDLWFEWFCFFEVDCQGPRGVA